MYQINEESEEIRNEIEMHKLRQKLANVRLKSETVKTFESLIDDDDEMTETIYRPKAFDASDETVLANDGQQQADEDQSALPSHDPNVTGGKRDEDDDAATMGSWAYSRDEERVKTNDGDDEDKTATEEVRYCVGISGDVVDMCFTDYCEHESYASEESSLSFYTTVKKAPLRLNTLETIGVVHTLEKWIDRIGVLNAIDETESGDMSHAADYHLRAFDSQGRMTKIAELREFVSRTLAQTTWELQSSNTFTALQRLNDSMLKTASDERQLEKEWVSSRIALTDLQTRKKRYKKLHFIKLWNIETERKRLAEEHEKKMMLIKTENEYVRIWEDTRLNESKEIQREKLHGIRAQIEVVEMESSVDDDCMAEVKRVFTKNSVDMDRRARTWGKIHKGDVGVMDKDIMTLETEKEQLDKSHVQLQAYVDELQTAIDEIEGHQRDRAERMRLKKEKMAIRIQTFWRAMMVRRFLGPFKPLKELFDKKSKKKPTKKNKK
ncbi:IQ motif, EF-hand binding site [Cinara cedri]|uniref:IQ motif, EF-hand binding site n=1 Tax=Cinara cedri TaxID=506608 RepID=A0A5E4NJC6_9HEMI|nr:IQ motif, EF-hand binding site [Cinara cedri]